MTDTTPAALATAARMLVDTFLRISPTDTVAVIHDASHFEAAAAIAAAARAASASTVVVDADQTVRDTIAADAFWTDPPPHLLALMQATAVNVFCVDETYAFRLDHQVHRLVRTGPDCSVFKVDEGIGTWSMTPAAIAAIEADGRRIVEAIRGATQVRVTSPAGTDVEMCLTGRECIAIYPVPERGSPYGLSIPLWGEYNWAPIEDATTGTIVVDGLSEAGRTMKVVSAPVTMTVRDGRVVAVEGGADADEFRAVLATDDGAAVVGELGVGGNPHAQAGHETEKALLGTVHFGFGSNHSYPGGRNRSSVHIDGVCRNVTVVADGRTVISSGRVVV
jgi:2,5-dihydroxypyridine 5,6-dioxygenase